MKVHRGLVLFTVIFAKLTVVCSDLDFIECGGDPVKTVNIEGCDRTPCPMQMAESYNVAVQPEYINPQVDNVNVDIGVFQYGAYFEQTVNSPNPCIYSCPITTKLIEPELVINFNLSARMVPLTSLFRINTTYINGDSHTTGFCILLDVIVFK